MQQIEIPDSAEAIRRGILELGRTCPGFRVGNLGWTAFGRPLPIVTAGTGPRRVFLSAGHHANEWITAPALLWAMERLGEAARKDESLEGISAGDLLRGATVTALPLGNPDGMDLVTGAIPPGSAQYDRAKRLGDSYPQIPFPAGWKANLLGVDLNLQYPAGWERARVIKFARGCCSPGPRDYVGRAPLSQRESLAIARYTRWFSPDAVVSFHTQGQVIYWQYGGIFVPGARELGEKLARVSGYTLADTPYASGFAGYKDWFLAAFRRPGYTVEMGLGENPLPLSQYEDICRRTLGILVTAAAG